MRTMTLPEIFYDIYGESPELVKLVEHIADTLGELKFDAKYFKAAEYYYNMKYLNAKGHLEINVWRNGKSDILLVREEKWVKIRSVIEIADNIETFQEIWGKIRAFLDV